MEVVVNKPLADLLQDLIDEVFENHEQDSSVDLQELGNTFQPLNVAAMPRRHFH